MRKTSRCLTAAMRAARMSGTFRNFATECCVDGGGAMAQRPMLGENCLPMLFAHSDNCVDMRVCVYVGK